MNAKRLKQMPSIIDGGWAQIVGMVHLRRPSCLFHQPQYGACLLK
jgi:hypothetical protein